MSHAPEDDFGEWPKYRLFAVWRYFGKRWVEAANRAGYARAQSRKAENLRSDLEDESECDLRQRKSEIRSTISQFYDEKKQLQEKIRDLNESLSRFHTKLEALELLEFLRRKGIDSPEDLPESARRDQD